jgi:carbamoyl-phosphate synthase large subunit
MNLLFTSSGRRDYLIEYFSDALNGLGTVHIGNSDPLCSSFTVRGCHVVTPPIYSTEYIPFLLEYCKQHCIKALVPLFDVDLPVLANARDQFRTIGTTLLVAEVDMVMMANDKWKSFQFLREHGFRTPQSWLNVEDALESVCDGCASFPLMIKPRWGLGSIGIMQATNPDELRLAYEMSKRITFNSHLRHESNANPDESILIQNRLNGQEYGLDVLNDLNGQYVATVCKQKLAMRSGETDIAVTRNLPQLESIGERLSKLVRHPGNLDVDVFVDGHDVFVLELNCRFGGGYPFTHLAGANFPAAIIAWLQGREPEAAWIAARDNVTSVKSVMPKLYTEFSCAGSLIA